VDDLLTKENLEYRDMAREIANKFVRPVAAELDRTAEYPWSVVRALQDAGLMGVWIPKEYGGRGGGVMNLCLVVEELSKACGGVGVTYAVNALASFPIIVGGTDEQKQKYLPDIAQGKTLMAFGLSEKASGSDAGSLKARAEKRDDFYVLNGDKKWNTNGNAATLYSVFCSTNPDRGGRGVSALLVEKGTPGQGIQWMLADMATKIEAARQLIYNCARAIDSGAKNVSKMAAMAKVFATDVAMSVTTDAVQLYGGYGYCKDYPIEKYMRDAKITQIYEGTNQIQRLVIGRSLIKEAAAGQPRAKTVEA